MASRTDISSILLVGAGAIVIDRASEFDHSRTQDSVYSFCKFVSQMGVKT